MMLTLGCWLIFSASTPLSPTPAELTRRSEASLERITAGGVRWLVRQRLGQLRDLGLRVTQFGPDSQLDFVTLEGETEVPFFSITAREGVWVTTFKGGPPLVTRPFEVFLPLMSAYLLLAKHDLQAFRGTGTELLVRETPATSTWVAARSPNTEAALRALLANLEKLQAAAGAEAAKVAELTKKLEALPLLEADNATGLVLHAGSPERGLFFSQIEFLTKRPEAFANPAPRPPPPLDEAFMQKAVAIGWDPIWKPGAAEREPDMLLINYDLSDRRRVPNPFGLSFQATFLQPRTQLVVTTSMPTGGFRPLWIDVSTGETRLLGDAWGALPVVMFPVASPDAKQVSVQAQATEPLTTQLQVIDVATGAVRNVGTPADQAFVNWIGDEGFVLVRRVQRPNSKETLSRIVRLSREGKETELLSNATRPVVLHRAKRMVFQDLSSGKWKTCDLKGKQQRLLGDGLSGFFAPTASPDGEVLLMMENTPAPEPRFVIVETGDVLKGPLGRGLWSNPQWR